MLEKSAADLRRGWGSGGIATTKAARVTFVGSHALRQRSEHQRDLVVPQFLAKRAFRNEAQNRSCESPSLKRTPPE